MIFPNADIRFIAINNGVDSDNQAENDMTPFINIFNEFYAKDTSRKIRAVFKAKGQAGKPLCTNPPYGYVKDPEDRLHWIVDEEAWSGRYSACVYRATEYRRLQRRSRSGTS